MAVVRAETASSATRIRTGTATGAASTSSDGLSSSSVAEVRSAAATARDRSGRRHGPFERGRAITPTRSVRVEDVGQCRGREGECGLADGVMSDERPSSFIYLPRHTATPPSLWLAGVGRGGDLGTGLHRGYRGRGENLPLAGGGQGARSATTRSVVAWWAVEVACLAEGGHRLAARARRCRRGGGNLSHKKRSQGHRGATDALSVHAAPANSAKAIRRGAHQGRGTVAAREQHPRPCERLKPTAAEVAVADGWREW